MVEAVDRRTLQVFNSLRPLHIFRGLKDEQLLDLTRRFERDDVESGTAICEEGKTGLEGKEGDLTATQYFYIVEKGRVKITRAGAGRAQTLEVGDFFGMEALAAERTPHPYTVTALGKATVLKLKKDDYAALLQQASHVAQALALMTTTRRVLYKQPWAWLNPNETVYLILQRHSLILYQREVLPGSLLALFLLGAAAAWYFQLTVVVWIALFFAAIALFIVWFVYVDWGNDYYIVTNQRVVYVEKVVLIYDSRINVSMAALTTVGTESGNVADRLLEYGNVEVKTLSKPMVLQAIGYPQLVAALIEEQIGRTKRRSRENEVNLLKNAIQNRIAPPMAEPKLEKPALAAPPVATGATTPLSRQLQQFFSIQLRYEEGDTIVYRKHWWNLITGLWWPSLALLLVVGLIGTAVAGLIVFPEPITPTVIALVGMLFFIILFGWWLYEFQDWRNDLYQVTPDRIVDIYRRPLGRETRDSAELDKIQGLRSERTGLLGRLLNFGNVYATIPGKEFSFEDVYDPLSVQEDIQRRIEASKARRAESESRRRREELVDLMSAYYLATRETEQKNGNQ
jgi:CRP-like cAMP-binding protein